MLSLYSHSLLRCTTKERCERTCLKLRVVESSIIDVRKLRILYIHVTKCIFDAKYPNEIL